ncbi:hypothetical protein THAOC_25963 [Thalassiosira oceanica]|uniref:Uncharacterized protein n=1 Tax=Thalassiosira oceanica TaxID=159749 RepID=K0RMP9_THAOC|nr:hypothetical protein THAOC_25963 [Thalassiosira oceanica]|eukprot:EJK54415.1 hypothetical protein THAOC_25963 [Thalassiosira oceanica]
MMKSVAVIATLASASAFAPAQIGQSSTQLNAFESEVGAQAPLGFFDPLGMLDDADQERFDRLRYVEIKHGRIAMLAFLGQIATRSGHYLDGNIDYAGHAFSSYPSGLAALVGPDAIPKDGLAQIVALIFFLEFGVMDNVKWNGGWEPEFPGDLRNGLGVASWDRFSDASKARKRGIELNNGRAAMMGILGLMVHEQLGTDMPIIGQL